MEKVQFATGIINISITDALGRDTVVQDNGTEVIIAHMKNGALETARRYSKAEFEEFLKLFN